MTQVSSIPLPDGIKDRFDVRFRRLALYNNNNTFDHCALSMHYFFFCLFASRAAAPGVSLLAGFLNVADAGFVLELPDALVAAGAGEG